MDLQSTLPQPINSSKLDFSSYLGGPINPSPPATTQSSASSSTVSQPKLDFSGYLGGSVIPSSPDDVTAAQQDIGNSDYNGLCQAFVEKVQGTSTKYLTAADAWNAQLNKAQGGLNGIKPGDAIYFAPDGSNGGDGHTAIYTGNGQMVSATYGGVKSSNLNDWISQTGQKPLGYIPYEGAK